VAHRRGHDRPLIREPYRVGKQLFPRWRDRFNARRGTYRLIYRNRRRDSHPSRSSTSTTDGMSTGRSFAGIDHRPTRTTGAKGVGSGHQRPWQQGSHGDASGPTMIFYTNQPGVTGWRAERVRMHNACMVALQIRDVPEDVRDALVAQARARGQSLQSFLLELVETQARRLRNTAVLDRFAGRSDGTRSLPGETATELAEERERRSLGDVA
jgi:hypothetical protein